MEFNKLYNRLLEELDPETEKDWGDILPHLSDPVIYYCYTAAVSRGKYDLIYTWSVKARTIEDAQDQVMKQAEKDWEESWYENAESARDDFDEDVDPDDAPENEFIEKFPVEHDDVALVGTGEDTVVVITTKKLSSSKQLEDYLDTVFGDV